MPAPKLRIGDLEDALLYASVDGFGNEVWFCRETGKFHYHTAYGDNFEELPNDVSNKEKYVALPDKHDFDLGKRLVMRFTSEQLPDDYDTVQDIFRRRGAYSRFKEFLYGHDKLQAWYDYEQQATLSALREWCKDHDIDVDD